MSGMKLLYKDPRTGDRAPVISCKGSHGRVESGVRLEDPRELGDTKDGIHGFGHVRELMAASAGPRRCRKMRRWMTTKVVI